MESPFSSIFSHEEEHRLMMRNSASYGLGGSILDISSSSLTGFRSSILLTPTLAPSIGSKYKLTDGLLSGKIVEWNGESFSTCGSSFTIVSKNSTTQVGLFSSSNTASDTVESVIEEITIPGFLIGKKSKLRFLPIWGYTNSASTKTLIIYLYTAGTGDQVIASNSATTTAISNHLHELRCLDSFVNQKTSNQVGNGNTGNPLLSTSQNVTSDFNVRFKAKWGAAVASETISLLGYSIELLP